LAKEKDMKLEAGWVPVALSSSIEAATSTGAIVEGFEIVVWRDSAGKAHVWEDRCPHRGMRMSFGFVRGDHIACLYHGWQYDTAGQCRYIPAHPDLEVPQTIKVPTFAVSEQAGIVWATAAGYAPPPALPSADATTPLRSLSIDAPLADVQTALLARFYVETADNVGTVDVDGMKLCVALQVVAPRRTAAHLVVLADAGADALSRLAGWATSLRAEVEASASLAEVA
jgi:nitrite reductase/ring-hydroxylating ferredoxin subunit